MLLTPTVKICVTARTVNHYKEKGYQIPVKYSEKSKKEVIDSSVPIDVKTLDLPKNSHTKIKYKCDNCGKEFVTVFSDWNKTTYKELGDLCKSCAATIKLSQAMKDKYGYDNASQVPDIIEKKKQTNFDKYGNEWSIASNLVRGNILETIKDRYGVSNPMQHELVKNKAKETNNRKYGGNSSLCSPEIREKSQNTCLKKYGVKNAFQAKEVQLKARNTLYKNGTVPISGAERKLCKILKEMYGEANCYPSYPVGSFSLDCLVFIDGIKIDFEYDGLYWHKNKRNKDGARNAILMNEGYKIVRIKANNKDDMPSTIQIQNAVDYLIKENHHLTFIDMNT